MPQVTIMELIIHQTALETPRGNNKLQTITLSRNEARKEWQAVVHQVQLADPISNMSFQAINKR